MFRQAHGSSGLLMLVTLSDARHDPVVNLAKNPASKTTTTLHRLGEGPLFDPLVNRSVRLDANLGLHFLEPEEYQTIAALHLPSPCYSCGPEASPLKTG